ncbi:MAG: MBL fold metallo-hydrolase [Pseudomonadota bacterium]
MTDPFNRDPSVRYGEVETLAVDGGVRLRRLTCQNPSPMTFTGTQTYLLGDGAEQAVVDPGPLDTAHLERILAATGGSLSHILVTHSHRDHSPGAAWLAARTGAPVLGFGGHGTGMSQPMQDLAAAGEIGGGEGGDPEFTPIRSLADGERITAASWSLQALHMPGHLSNHLSFVLEGAGAVFTGDTVMGWATTLVSPPEGDMAAFMSTLDRLAGRDDKLYLPGHGHPVTDPRGMVAHQRTHREARAAQILASLAEGPANAATLAARIYDDVDAALLPAAARNVLATLIWQTELGTVRAEGPLSANVSFRRL